MAHPAVGSNELNSAVEDAHDTLLSVQTIFPFILFPDSITVDRVKVTITKWAFFKTAEVISIQIEDVLNVEVDVGPFFGSLKIWTRFFTDHPMMINYLSRQDAIDIKQLLQGYIIARNKEIDCSHIAKEELVPMLMQLGQAAPE